MPATASVDRSSACATWSSPPRSSTTSATSMATAAPAGHRDADVGLAQRERVVDAVADHRHDAALRAHARG